MLRKDDSKEVVKYINLQTYDKKNYIETLKEKVTKHGRHIGAKQICTLDKFKVACLKM